MEHEDGQTRLPRYAFMLCTYRKELVETHTSYTRKWIFSDSIMTLFDILMQLKDKGKVVPLN